MSQTKVIIGIADGKLHPDALYILKKIMTDLEIENYEFVSNTTGLLTIHVEKQGIRSSVLAEDVGRYLSRGIRERIMGSLSIAL